MQITQEHLSTQTPMGANLIEDGATFRVWAPGALEVHLKINSDTSQWSPNSAILLFRDKPQQGHWSGFVRGAKDGDHYRFYVVGKGSTGLKRDPYARELVRTGFPDCDCIIRDPNSYPWRCQDYRPPAFNDLILYQLHIGTFYSVDSIGSDNRLERSPTFLDVLDRVEYLAELGVNAIQLLPIDEFPTEHSAGYNGTDYFSPEMDYSVPPEKIDPYLNKVNLLLTKKNCAPLKQDQLVIPINQLKVLIDIFHLFGIAVFFDVVYNHAGGDFGDQSIYFFDREENRSNNDSLYFTDAGWAGGLVFDYQKDAVRQFLIDNANFYVEEYRIDGIRYDEVTVIDRHGGWFFCQSLTDTMKFMKPSAIHIAEYWNDQRWWALWATRDKGAGFHSIWHDGLRDSIRGAIGQAARGREAHIDIDQIKESLYRPYNFPAAWKTVQFLENHDIVQASHGDRQPRIAALSDSSNARSWYARSRARVAAGLLMTSPGIPMLFMGQEFLEDKYWSDNPDYFKNTLIYWDGLKNDKAMIDYLRFTRELIWLRRRQPALRAEAINVFHVHNDNRIIAFHRWVEGFGRDVVVIASLNESTFWEYKVGFPQPGRWLEVFNSDVYENWVNPWTAGNGGIITSDGEPFHAMPYSAEIVIPANSILVFARDSGD
jgi:1,4-alpha-glucan branching enzyme